mgnify:CR=1 FL=1
MARHAGKGHGEVRCVRYLSRSSWYYKLNRIAVMYFVRVVPQYRWKIGRDYDKALSCQVRHLSLRDTNLHM